MDAKSNEKLKSSICGLWVGPSGEVYTSMGQDNQARAAFKFQMDPFAWMSLLHSEGVPPLGEPLKGEGVLNYLCHFKTLQDYKSFVESRRGYADTYQTIKPFEHQYLLATKQRMFEHMHFRDLRRMQLDIETACSIKGGFSNPKNREDRILAIGIQLSDHQVEFIELSEFSGKAEKALLERLNQVIQKYDPDAIEGHNIFNFDLDYLRTRSYLYKVPCAWGRFDQKATFRPSRIRIAERWVDFIRCDIPGRTVVDTYLMAQIYDLTARELPSYGLKDVAVYMGITDPSSGERTYIDGSKIEQAFNEDRESFRAYLADDLRETKGIAECLLPTYVAQIKDFPMTLQEALLRGSATKVESILLEKYYHAKESLPLPEPVASFSGGYTESFESGVFKYVLSYDIASLYPSLLLSLGKNPRPDSLGVFIPLLKELKEYRIKYKQLAKSTEDPDLKLEYGARQASFKILINSFYGYLGFQGARFADSHLASEITSKGRSLLRGLIEAFKNLGCTILEADTDGIYLSSKQYSQEPEALLRKVLNVVPQGIDLEFNGSYHSMFCYKSKNYALYDGQKVSIRGSALRSRATEPYLKNLNDCLIHYLLGVSKQSPQELMSCYRLELESQKMPVDQLLKGEYLSQSPEAYEKAIKEGKKSRRASQEAALKMRETMRMGQKVSYFITLTDKKRTPDWQRAMPLEAYNHKTCPYDPFYYIKKMDDWAKRYEAFLSQGLKQENLF